MPSSTNLTPLETAITLMTASQPCELESENVPLAQLAGRVLARDIVADIDLPRWDYSAMDGYAVRHADLRADGDTRLPVSQRIPAGHPGVPLMPGSAARIFTGAQIPSGSDTVVQQENCLADGDTVIIRGSPSPGTNIRRAGSEISRGAACLGRGTRLQAGAIGLAATLGFASLPVLRKIKIALISTGDELVSPGQPLGTGQIYSSNQFILMALLNQAGYKVIDLGLVPDRFEATVKLLSKAADQADVIVTSGGVSVGEEDHVRTVLQQRGRLDLWKLDIKPGKPLAFGAIGNIPVVSLPGNPVSSFVTCVLVLMPYLAHLQGATHLPCHAWPVRAAFEWPHPDSRREFLRARVRYGSNGPEAEIYREQNSGAISSTVWMEGFVDLPAGCAVRPGDTVQYLPLAGLING